MSFLKKKEKNANQIVTTFKSLVFMFCDVRDVQWANVDCFNTQMVVYLQP